MRYFLELTLQHELVGDFVSVDIDKNSKSIGYDIYNKIINSLLSNFDGEMWSIWIYKIILFFDFS